MNDPQNHTTRTSRRFIRVVSCGFVDHVLVICPNVAGFELDETGASADARQRLKSAREIINEWNAFVAQESYALARRQVKIEGLHGEQDRGRKAPSHAYFRPLYLQHRGAAVTAAVVTRIKRGGVKLKSCAPAALTLRRQREIFSRWRRKEKTPQAQEVF